MVQHCLMCCVTTMAAMLHVATAACSNCHWFTNISKRIRRFISLVHTRTFGWPRRPLPTWLWEVLLAKCMANYTQLPIACLNAFELWTRRRNSASYFVEHDPGLSWVNCSSAFMDSGSGDVKCCTFVSSVWLGCSRYCPPDHGLLMC